MARNHIQGQLLDLVLTTEVLQLVLRVVAQPGVAGLRGLVPDPGVLHGLGSREPLADIAVDEILHQVLAIGRHRVPVLGLELQVPLLDLCEELGVGVPTERWISAEHGVHHHAQGPHVRGLRVGLLQDLGAHVVGRAHSGLHHAALLEYRRKAEVDDLHGAALDGPRGLEEEVLGLQVPVADVLAVHVVHAPHHLLHDRCRLDLREGLRAGNRLQQLTSFTDLHDQVHHAVVLERLVQPDDVGMVH
mmetsp:Transcript_10100/g.29880  ORF Transcript_10100/g.29880 Transcript_10100/m.29880 type:complete len:246 (-) Transcript_10100:463-1200(-)